MNWLIYISGWFVGWAVWNGLINYKSPTGSKKEEDWVAVFKLIIWTMMWIWACWRFI